MMDGKHDGRGETVHDAGAAGAFNGIARQDMAGWAWSARRTGTSDSKVWQVAPVVPCSVFIVPCSVPRCETKGEHGTLNTEHETTRRQTQQKDFAGLK